MEVRRYLRNMIKNGDVHVGRYSYLGGSMCKRSIPRNPVVRHQIGSTHFLVDKMNRIYRECLE